MKSSVYIETSILSFLTARPSSDIRAAAWQKITLDWWEKRSHLYNLYTSGINGRRLMQNEILNELWEVKDRMAEEYHYDIEAMASSLKAAEIDGKRNPGFESNSKPSAQSSTG